MTKDCLRRLSALLEAAFGVPFDPEQYHVWQAALKDYSDEQIESGLTRLLREWRPRFAGDRPFPADLVALLPGRLDLDTEAEAAWEKAVHSALHGPERYDPLTGTWPTGADLDPVTRAAAGGSRGLRRIAEALEDPQTATWVRREFVERYKHMKRLNEAGTLPEGATEGPRAISGRKARPRLLGECLREGCEHDPKE